jgi:gas vesicle protein
MSPILFFVGVSVGFLIAYMLRPKKGKTPQELFKQMDIPIHHCQEGNLNKVNGELSEMHKKDQEDIRRLSSKLREQNDADLFLASTRICEEIKAGRKPDNTLVDLQTN